MPEVLGRELPPVEPVLNNLTTHVERPSYVGEAEEFFALLLTFYTTHD